MNHPVNRSSISHPIALPAFCQNFSKDPLLLLPLPVSSFSAALSIIISRTALSTRKCCPHRGEIWKLVKISPLNHRNYQTKGLTWNSSPPGVPGVQGKNNHSGLLALVFLFALLIDTYKSPFSSFLRRNACTPGINLQDCTIQITPFLFYSKTIPLRNLYIHPPEGIPILLSY